MPSRLSEALLQPVERKVVVASSSAAAISFVLWLLSAVVFHGPVPGPVGGMVDTVVPGLAALIGGWCARHTTRMNVPPTGQDPKHAAEG